MDATINGQSVRLAFDTGANAPILYRSAAETLGLAVDAASGLTVPCDLGLFGSTDPGERFLVVDPPGAAAHLEMDGILPWTMLQNNIMGINANAEELAALSKPPEEGE